MILDTKIRNKNPEVVLELYPPIDKDNWVYQKFMNEGVPLGKETTVGWDAASPEGDYNCEAKGIKNKDGTISITEIIVTPPLSVKAQRFQALRDLFLKGKIVIREKYNVMGDK